MAPPPRPLYFVFDSVACAFFRSVALPFEREGDRGGATGDGSGSGTLYPRRRVGGEIKAPPPVDVARLGRWSRAHSHRAPSVGPIYLVWVIRRVQVF